MFYSALSSHFKILFTYIIVNLGYPKVTCQLHLYIDLRIFTSNSKTIKMADGYVQYYPVISRFARLLLRISLQLTPEDLSNIKLILVVDGYLTQTKMESLQNAADLLRALWSRGLIAEENLTLISDILSHIHRQDCVRLIQEFIDSQPPQNLRALTLPKETSADPMPNGGPDVELECYSHSFFPKSRLYSNSSDDDKIREEISLEDNLP